MKRRLIRVLALIAVILGAAFLYYVWAPDPELPPLTAKLQRATIRVGDRERTYSYYLPADLPPSSPLLFVLHGSTQDGDEIRTFTGYEFDALADRHHFVVIYPDGYQGHWNDCRKVAPYAARKLNIDDKGFIGAIIDRFQREGSIDPKRIYVMGYSNGAQLAFRLAFEMSDQIAAIAGVAANLPADDNLECRPSGEGVAVLLINGTRDPISPYQGGEVTLFGFQNRGTARSAEATAAYFAERNGLSAPPQVSTRGEVEKRLWNGSKAVVLYSVIGGGHVIPQQNFRAPRILGRTTHELDAPDRIWAFFSESR